MEIFNLESFANTLNANDRKSMGCTNVYAELNKFIAEKDKHYLYPQNLFNLKVPTILVLITKKNLIIGKEDSREVEIQIKSKMEITDVTYVKKASRTEGDLLKVSFKNGDQLTLDANQDTIGEEGWIETYNESINIVLKELSNLNGDEIDE